MADNQQLNLTVVALVALVAIVGLVALVLNAGSVAKVATGSQIASASSACLEPCAEPNSDNCLECQNLAGQGFLWSD